MRYEKGLTNLSYTNKDFNSIYSELLDMVDRISPKWKPSQSNESDAGVLLLKLDALIGDKNNYNIDKNILELFPESVTQYPNAREIFEQCGYVMPYYRAADLYVKLNLDVEPEIGNENIKNLEGATHTYQLPRFTMVTDSKNSIIFTITENIELPFKETKDLHALQGSINKYNINNDYLVTLKNLDSNNRIYFNQLNVAENGIFIESVKSGKGTEDFLNWEKVDNLQVQPFNKPCYKFGLSRDGSKCYIEFPADISNIIGEGLHIYYITTSGSKGIIDSQTICQFFGDVTATLKATKGQESQEQADISLSSDNVYINNIQPSYDGRDPESISDAYKSYQRVKGTFDTLVSLKDYTNFILNSEFTSNGFICDRTNDIQASTTIVTFDGEKEGYYTSVKKSDGTNPDLTAFDLRIYATRPVYTINSADSFNLSFSYLDDTSDLIDELDDLKCIQHNFELLENNEIINIQLRFPINCRIIPFTKLDITQQLEIRSKIIEALFKALNSNKLTYGEEISYDLIYDTISLADTRIKSVVLDDLDYTVYATYKDNNGKEQSVHLPDEVVPDTVPNYAIINKFIKNIKAKSILSGVTPLFETSSPFNYSTIQKKDKEIESVGKVSTNTSLEITFGSNASETITLLPNEAVYFTQNNYITKQTFSNYCKYFYKLTPPTGLNQIPKDSLYQLDTDDFIIFLWKDSNEDADYRYQRFGKGTIICPTFALNTTWEGAISNFGTDRYSKALFNASIFTEDNSSDYETIYTLPNTSIEVSMPNGSKESFSPSQVVAKTGSECTLTSPKTIYVKSTNKLELKGTDFKFYWILNKTILNSDSGDMEYHLFNQSSTEYILRSGEYLFYSPITSNSSFNLLGPGTKLTLTSGTGPLRVIAKSYNEVLFGTSSLLTRENLWYYANVTIEATEMQYFNIAEEGTQIRFTRTNTNGSFLKLDNTGLYMGNSLASLKPGLQGMRIEYMLKGESSFTELPQIFVSGAAWTGHTILSLKCGPNKEQQLSYTNGKVLKRTQSITAKSTWNASTNQFEDLSSSQVIETGENKTALTIQSSHDLELLGDSDLDVTDTDLLGTVSNVDFYSYSKYPLNEDDKEQTDYSVIYNMTANKTKVIPIGLTSLYSAARALIPILTSVNYTSFLAYSKYEECVSGQDYFNLTASKTYYTPSILIRGNGTGSFIKISHDKTSFKSEDLTITKDSTHYTIKFSLTGTEAEVSLQCEFPPDLDLDLDSLSGKFYPSSETSSSTTFSFNRSEGQYTYEVTLNNGIEYEFEINIPISYSSLFIEGEVEIKDTGLRAYCTKDMDKLYDSDNAINTINNYNLKESGMHYLLLTLTSSESHIYCVVEGSASSTIKILSPVPYTTSTTLEALIGEIVTLDTDHKFHYTHKVAEGDLISNPLDPLSFLEATHPYNRCTLCRWDTSDNTIIKIVNKIK